MNRFLLGTSYNAIKEGRIGWVRAAAAEIYSPPVLTSGSIPVDLRESSNSLEHLIEQDLTQAIRDLIREGAVYLAISTLPFLMHTVAGVDDHKQAQYGLYVRTPLLCAEDDIPYGFIALDPRTNPFTIYASGYDGLAIDTCMRHWLLREKRPFVVDTLRLLTRIATNHQDMGIAQNAVHVLQRYWQMREIRGINLPDQLREEIDVIVTSSGPLNSNEFEGARRPRDTVVPLAKRHAQP